MFRTPNLHKFLAIWYVQPTQLPGARLVGSEEFLTERFIEDVMEGNRSIALIVEGVRISMATDHRMTEPVPVTFEVLTTETLAKQLIELGYKVKPENPGEMQTKWDDPDDGMKWNEMLVCINHATRENKEHWDKPIRCTDDGDPHAPWFRIVGLKTDDEGPFLAIEEIQS